MNKETIALIVSVFYTINFLLSKLQLDCTAARCMCMHVQTAARLDKMCSKIANNVKLSKHFLEVGIHTPTHCFSKAININEATEGPGSSDGENFSR